MLFIFSPKKKFNMVTRKYNVPDADCMAEGLAVREIYLADEALFAAFDAVRFNAAFKTDWQDALADAAAHQTAETRLDQQKQETEDVLQAMATGRQCYAMVKYFAQKAYGTKPNLANKIGLNNYDTAHADQHEFALFLKNMHTQCNSAELKPLLLAEGMTQVHIDSIEAAYIALRDEEKEQGAFIKTSASATDDRITVYNRAYQHWQHVAEASKVVFYGNPTKLNEYKLPEGPQPDPDINFKGKAIDGTSGSPLKNVLVKINALDLTTTTNYAGNYSFVSIPAGSYEVEYTLPGYSPQQLPITILASGVVVQNVSLVVT